MTLRDASILAALALLACQPTPSGGNGGGGGGDGTCASSTDDPCPVAIEAFCASGMAPCTWDDAQKAESWQACSEVTLNMCSDVLVAINHGVDTGVRYYYDPHTGALYRAESYSGNFGGSDTCEAGSGCMPVCDDPHPVFLTGPCP